MHEIIDTGMPAWNQPFSWARRAGDFVFTTQGPVTADCTILKGDITAQAQLTLENLRHAMAAAGGTLDDIAQVTIYLLDVADMAPVDAVYGQFFKPPYPTRATLIVAALVAPGMRIEVQATALIPPRPTPP
jgi:enamine deaminase RidA (YjgF/YER057c/UK114 family)